MKKTSAFLLRYLNQLRQFSFLKILLYIILILLIYLCIHAFLDIYLSPGRNTIHSWNKLLDNFDSPIKIGVFILAILTLIFTLKRIERTDKTIELIKDNNQFNNFFNHKELFKKYMLKTDLYWILQRKLDVHEDVVITRLYNFLYYTSYKDFKPEINKKEKESILALNNNIKEYRYTNLGDLISNIATGKLNLDIDVFRFELDDIIGKVYQNLNIELLERNKTRPLAYGFSPHILYSSLHCYIKFELYEDALGFDGDAETLNTLINSNFRTALNSYIKHLTLDKQLRLSE